MIKLAYLFTSFLFIISTTSLEDIINALSIQNSEEIINQLDKNGDIIINDKKISGSKSEVIRSLDQFFDKNFEFEKIIVHGHSPEKEVINFPYRINVDTGSFFSGKLSCVCINDKNKKREFIYS